MSTEQVGTTHTGEEGKRTRLATVDSLRGLVMVAMAIDHVHYYFTSPALTPRDVANTTGGQFATRWVTHFCAPVFVFLAGAGAYLRGAKGRSRWELSRFLVSRGVWLIALDLTVVRWGWTFTANLWCNSGQVMWAIGWSMILLAGLVWLPRWAVGAFAAVTIAGHNAFDKVDPVSLGDFRPLWLVLHTPGGIDLRGGVSFEVYYPLVPWVGVIAAGYLFGAVLALPAPRRGRIIAAAGLSLVVLFLALRAANVYGDPKPWVVQPTAEQTVMSFVNCEKYPPSLLFLTMTLGPGLLLLALPAGWWGWVGRQLAEYGRVPMLYYLVHIPLTHALAIVFATLRYGTGDFLVGDQWLIAPEQYPTDWGYDLWVVYVVWAGVVVTLYPLCAWFGRLKQRKKSWWWLSYL